MTFVAIGALRVNSLPTGKVCILFFCLHINLLKKSAIPSESQTVWIHFDLGPNCLQRLSSDDTSRQRVN